MSTRDYRTDGSTPNERIAAVIAGMREVAMHDLGFKRSGTRADGEIEMTQTGVRIRYEARFTNGEGRIVLYITKPNVPLRTREIQIYGREVITAELERCRKELLNIVRRVTAARR